jgi:hypothetical protein
MTGHGRRAQSAAVAGNFADADCIVNANRLIVPSPVTYFICRFKCFENTKSPPLLGCPALRTARTHIKLRKTKPREWSREGASLLLAGPRIPKKCCFKKCGLMEARGPALDVLRLLPALKGPRVLSVGAAEAARAAKTAACG